MKTLIASLALVAGSFSIANAQEYGRVTNVSPIYKNSNVRTYVQQCEDVRTPVYEKRRGANGSEVLSGMIIGGLIGKGITGDDEGAAIGAVVGGIASGERRRTTQSGYTVERVCRDVPTYVTEQYVDSYNVKFTWGGKTYSQEVYQKYSPGDRIEIYPSLN